MVLIAVPLGVAADPAPAAQVRRRRRRRLRQRRSGGAGGRPARAAVRSGCGFGLLDRDPRPDASTRSCRCSRNTIAGLKRVDQTLVEAGPRDRHVQRLVLLRVELPLALPVIMAGVRTALVLIVGTATLATFINGGGLGTIITSGITLSATGGDRRRGPGGAARAADRVGSAGCSSWSARPKGL